MCIYIVLAICGRECLRLFQILPNIQNYLCVNTESHSVCVDGRQQVPSVGVQVRKLARVSQLLKEQKSNQNILPHIIYIDMFLLVPHFQFAPLIKSEKIIYHLDLETHLLEGNPCSNQSQYTIPSILFFHEQCKVKTEQCKIKQNI